MKVFVAGATGVLGRRVVPRLLRAGHDVSAVARDDRAAASLRAQGASAVRVDLFDREPVLAAVAHHDAVVNLATSIPPTSRMLLPGAWRTNDRLRTAAAGNLADAALAGGAARFVQESVLFVYRDGRDRWLDEDAPTDPRGVLASATIAEGHAARFARDGEAGVALRFGLFIAPESGHTADAIRTARRGWAGFLGGSEAYSSLVHADDAAAAVVAALRAPSGTYNVCEDDPATSQEHADALAQALGRPVRPLPEFLGHLPRLALQARSQRVSNRRFTRASGWSPGVPRTAEAWPRIVAAVERSERAET